MKNKPLDPRKCDRNHGFTLVELIIVVTMGSIITAAVLPVIKSSLEFHQAEAGLQMVAAQLRQARQRAVDRRRVQRVTFSLPRTITLEWKETGLDSWIAAWQVDLPEEMEFRVEPGVPTAVSLTPDQMGAGSPIDFAGGTVLYFHPDGSVVNDMGQVTSGVAYCARPGDLKSARAVTVFGATGRIKTWTLREGEWK